MNDASRNSADRLVRMANQIASFFAGQPGDACVSGTADHIKAFWTPKMCREIIAFAEGGGAGLSPLALKAVKAMAAKQM